jgi:hypothetical protein
MDHIRNDRAYSDTGPGELERRASLRRRVRRARHRDELGTRRFEDGIVAFATCGGLSMERESLDLARTRGDRS